MLVLASVTVLTLDYHGEANRAITHLRNGVQVALSPVQRVISDLLHPVGDVVAGAFLYGSVQAQNVRLEQEVGQLDQRLAESSVAAAQVAQVDALDHLGFVGDLASVDAEVISAPSSNFEYTLEINRGTSAGVGPGMPVVGAKGFVGTVLTASSSTAVVLLAADARSRIGVRLGTSTSSAALAIASGQGPGHPLLASTSGFNPRVGEMAFTSGLFGELYPPGLPVGVVSAVRSSPGGLGDSVLIRPLVDVSSLGYVGVVIWTPPA